MVSTIANGGMYMPPHILLQSTDEMKGDARLQPAAFHPANQLPAKLPDGAHRVIKEMTSATMREIMRGIVVEGTGKEAALNGYSSGGKTGTAEKIDRGDAYVLAHQAGGQLCGHGAGVEPGDHGGGGDRYADALARATAARCSAPVFAQVAQQVLEYLGVPHDQPLKTKKEMQLAKAAAPKDVFDSDAGGERR